MAKRPRYVGQRAYAVSLAWRVGAFLLLTLGFPFIMVLIMAVSDCRSACGAVMLVSGLALKPVIFLVFVGSITWITMARVCDLGVPRLLGLLVPVLLLTDWQFGVLLGVDWIVGFGIGGLFGAPYQFLSALLCMGFLVCITTHDDGGSAAERFGAAGKLALTVTVLIVVAGLIRIAVVVQAVSLTMSGEPGALISMLPLLKTIGTPMQVTPFLVALQAGLFGYLIWRSRAGSNGRPALRQFVTPAGASVPSFGRRS